MSKLADLSSTITTALKILGKSGSFAWQVFEQVNGKRTSSNIAKSLKKQYSNVSLKLGNLEDVGIIQEVRKVGNAVIYKKLPELKNLKPKSRFDLNSTTKLSQSRTTPNDTSANSNSSSTSSSTIINKIIEIGKKYGIENIDRNWIDSLVILNFMETACTKFLMDHGIDENTVKTFKWEKKFSRMKAILFQEAKAKDFSIRTASIDFFKSFNSTRNDQDHIAHLPSSKVHKSDLDLLKKNVTIFIKTVFDEHKEYCPKV